MEVLYAVEFELEEVRDLAFLLHLVEDPEREEGGETLAVGRALVKAERMEMESVT